MERQRATDVLCKSSKKSLSHKRIRKKRTAIPVATPKVPSLASMGSGDGLGMNYNMKDDKNWRVDPVDRGKIVFLSFLANNHISFDIINDDIFIDTFLYFQYLAKRPIHPNRVIRSTLRDPGQNNTNMLLLVCGRDFQEIHYNSNICSIHLT